MKSITLFSRMLLFSVAIILSTGKLGSAQTTSEHVPGIILVKFEQGKLREVAQRIFPNDIQSSEIKNILQQVDFTEGRKIFESFLPGDTMAVSRSGEIVKLIDLSHWYVIKIADTTNITQFVKQLSAIPGIASAVPSYLLEPSDIFPNDPRFQSGQQWGLYNYGAPGNDIHAPQAWEKSTGRNDVTVAVVDGGVDYDHTDLDPGNRSRVIQGWDAGDGDSNPMDDISSSSQWAGHGTKVAGVIGAITNNNNKVAGVMWNCKLLPVKIAKTSGPWWDIFGFYAGSAFDSDIAEGIDWARTHGAHVINMSFGGKGSGFWENLIYGGNPITEASWNAYQQGVALLAAMGNDDNSTVQYPAGYPWVIAVGATNQNDQRVTGVGWGSNTGSHIDIVAPGISYYTTVRNQSDGSFSGTSCATPVASGVAGLIISKSLDRGLNLTNDDVKHLLEVTANDKPPTGWDQEYGWGRVNAADALTLISEPYIVTQGTSVGGTSTLTWGSHAHTFYNNGSLPSGVYYGVKQYKITKHTTFSQAYSQTPKVWVRERQTQGWSYANPNLELAWAKINNITTTGFDVETVVYWIGTNSIGQQINAYYPCAPSQATVAYTVAGRRDPPYVTITGPTCLGWKQSGTWTANPSGGNGSYTYEWRWRYNGTGSWSGVVSTSQTYQRTMLDTDFELQVKVTSLGQDAYDTHYVEYCINKAAGQSHVEDIAVPDDFILFQNFPNPFNPETKISFGLPEETHVKLVIFDLIGREVKILLDQNLVAGFHSTVWDGRDNSAHPMPSGIYICKLITNNFQDWKKLTLIR